MMKGFRTYLVAALMAGLPMLSAWLLSADWVATLEAVGVPQIAIVPLAGLIAGAVTGLMRAITTTPPGKDS